MCNKKTAVVSGNLLPPPLLLPSSSTTATPPLPPPRPRPASSAAANATAAIVMVSLFSSLRNADGVHVHLSLPIESRTLTKLYVRWPTSVDGLAVFTSLEASNALLLTTKLYYPLANVGRWPRRLFTSLEASNALLLTVVEAYVDGRWCREETAVGNIGASQPPAALSRCRIVEERGAGKEGVVVKHRHCIRRGGGVVVVLFLGCFYRATPGRPARGHILI